MAVPAILTGMYPRKGQFASARHHPQNLFTLLGGSYRMVVHEVRTDLFRGDPSAAPQYSRSARLKVVASDLWILYLHVLAPDAWSSALPDVTATWTHFTSPPPSPVVRRAAVKRRREEAFVDRAEKFRALVDTITPSDEPCLYFLHIMLPHRPWHYTVSGRKYIPWNLPGLGGEQWGKEEWWVIQGYQRHLLQLAFVDRLLGELLAKLRATGLYDRALVVIVADHGVVFSPGENRRKLELTEHDEEQIPWPTDGCSAIDPSCPERRELVVFSGEERTRQVLPVEIHARRATLERKLALFGSGSPLADLYRVGRYRDLVGRSPRELGVARARGPWVELSREGLAHALHEPEAFAAIRVRGSIAPEDYREGLHVALATRGIVHAVVPVLNDRKGTHFAALLPEGAFSGNPQELRLFSVEGPPEAPQLRRARLR